MALTQEVRSAPPLYIDPAEAMQEVLDGLIRDLRHAEAQVERLELADPDDYKQGMLTELLVSREEGYSTGEEGGTWSKTRYEQGLDAWIRYRDWLRGQVAKITNDMVKNGLEERAVRLQEAQTALLTDYLEAVFASVGLSREQKRLAGAAMRDALPILEGKETVSA
jgi:hypothetical protein